MIIALSIGLLASAVAVAVLVYCIARLDREVVRLEKRAAENDTVTAGILCQLEELDKDVVVLASKVLRDSGTYSVVWPS